MLRILRTNLGYTQEQWAQRIGVSTRTVSRWETHKTTLRLIEINAMSRILGFRGSHAFPESIWDEYLKLQRRACISVKDCLGKTLPSIAAPMPSQSRYAPKYVREDVPCVECGEQADRYDHRDYFKPLEVEPVCHSCNKHRGIAFNTFLDHPEHWERLDWTQKPRTGRWAYAHTPEHIAMMAQRAAAESIQVLSNS